MKAFEEIYRQYKGPLYSFLLKLTGGDRDAAEELTQEAFYQAFLSFHRYRGNCSFFTWLCQIAKNCWFKYLRKKKDTTVDFAALEESLFEEAADPQQICETKLLKEELRQAILQMEKNQRDVLVLRIYFECSFKEIAALLRISENAAKVSFHRSKEKLRRKLSAK